MSETQEKKAKLEAQLEEAVAMLDRLEGHLRQQGPDSAAGLAGTGPVP